MVSGRDGFGWVQDGCEGRAGAEEEARSTGAVSAQGQGRRPNPEIIGFWVVSESNLGWDEG